MLAGAGAERPPALIMEESFDPIVGLLRGSAALALLALAAHLGVRHRGQQTARIGVALCASALAYLGAQSFISPLGDWDLLTVILISCASAAPSLIWVLAMAIFRERFAVRRMHVLVTCGAVAVGWLSASDLFPRAFPGARTAELLDTMVHQVVSLGLLCLSLIETQRGAVHDLLEPRRRLRIAFVASIAAFAGLVLVTEVALGDEPAPWQLDALNAASIVLLAAGGLALVVRHGRVFLESNPTLPQSVAPAEDPVFHRLQRWIEARGFLEADLTVGKLAQHLGVQEYRLRRLLNQEIGFRNFRDFLHQHRIREACSRLRSPAGHDLPILNLSLEVGYSSLATFNRAFKSVTGVSPTEYRERENAHEDR